MLFILSYSKDEFVFNSKNYAGVLQSREYMNKSRPNGFHPNELKLYWNYEQIENLCPEKSIRIECDPSDEDARLNLCQFPVQQRNHRGQITFIHDAIQQAVFNLPSNAQIILLNFAVKFLQILFIFFV